MGLTVFEKWQKILLPFLIVHVCRRVGGCEIMTKAGIRSSGVCILSGNGSKGDFLKLSGLLEQGQ